MKKTRMSSLNSKTTTRSKLKDLAILLSWSSTTSLIHLQHKKMSLIKSKILFDSFWMASTWQYSPTGKQVRERHTLWSVTTRQKIANKTCLISFPVRKEVFFQDLWKWLCRSSTKGKGTRSMLLSIKYTMKRYLTFITIQWSLWTFGNPKMGKFQFLIYCKLK